MVELSGSVEVMIGLGIADAIVDLVETGSTLAANRLRVLEELGCYQTVLIQNANVIDARLRTELFEDLKELLLRGHILSWNTMFHGRGLLRHNP